MIQLISSLLGLLIGEIILSISILIVIDQILPRVSYVPKYMRTGPYTLWDDLGIGNP